MKLSYQKKIIFSRQEIWIHASDLMYNFCSNVTINYFNNIFKNMRFSEDYTAVCLIIVNDDSAVIDLI